MRDEGAPTTGPTREAANADSGDLSVLWDRIEELVDEAPSLEALGAHRLHLVAARLRRSRGLPVPAQLQAEERRAALIALAARPLLERALAAYSGKLMLMKGAEVAAHYRHPSDRFFSDLDLLADDATAAQGALIDAGFVPCGDPAIYEHAQHLRPLIWPGIPLFIEIHRRPNIPRWLPERPADEILGLSEPSATRIEGLLAPDPAAHALLLVAHSWAETPLGRLADLVDVAALTGGETRRRADTLARHWGWEGMWQVALSAGDAVLSDHARPERLPGWARHLACARDRTVLEDHIARFAAPAAALPVSRAHIAVASAIRLTTTRRDGELWSRKLRRSKMAVANALSPRSAHDRKLSERLLR